MRDRARSERPCDECTAQRATQGCGAPSSRHALQQRCSGLAHRRLGLRSARVQQDAQPEAQQHIKRRAGAGGAPQRVTVAQHAQARGNLRRDGGGARRARHASRRGQQRASGRACSAQQRTRQQRQRGRVRHGGSLRHAALARVRRGDGDAAQRELRVRGRVVSAGCALLQGAAAAHGHLQTRAGACQRARKPAWQAAASTRHARAPCTAR